VQNAYPQPKERDKPPNFRNDSADFDEDAQQNEDVRQMQTETDTLRRRSRPPETIDPAFQFPPPETLAKSKSHKPPSQPSERGRVREMSLPLPLQETPEIRKNKLMRGDPVVGKGSARRKSSLSRGKRISSTFENTGVIGELLPLIYLLFYSADHDGSIYYQLNHILQYKTQASISILTSSYRNHNERNSCLFGVHIER
jgi:kinetochore protein Mis13/DSN1